MLPAFRDEVLPNLSGVRVFGIQLDIQQTIKHAAADRGVDLSEGEESALMARAQRAQPVLRDAEVLWVDATPENNILERRLLHRVGVFVDTARSTDEAIEALGRGPGGGRFDLVISDVARASEPTAGLAMIERLRAAGHDQRVVFYVGQVAPGRAVPAGAFGLTNRPDELLHLVIDALERERGGGPAARAWRPRSGPNDRTDLDFEAPLD